MDPVTISAVLTAVPGMAGKPQAARLGKDSPRWRAARFAATKHSGMNRRRFLAGRRNWRRWRGLRSTSGGPGRSPRDRCG